MADEGAAKKQEKPMTFASKTYKHTMTNSVFD